MNYEDMTDRELDIAVAEKVMGWKTNSLKIEWWKEINPNTHHHKGLVNAFNPSTDISVAWEVVERLNAEYFVQVSRHSSIIHHRQWYCSVEGGKTFVAMALTAPRAICIAALKAIE